MAKTENGLGNEVLMKETIEHAWNSRSKRDGN